MPRDGERRPTSGDQSHVAASDAPDLVAQLCEDADDFIAGQHGQRRPYTATSSVSESSSGNEVPSSNIDSRVSRRT